MKREPIRIKLRRFTTFTEVLGWMLLLGLVAACCFAIQMLFSL